MNNKIILLLKKYKKIFCSLISFFAITGIAFFFKIGTEKLIKKNFNNNIIFIFLFIAFYFIIDKVYNKINKKIFFFSLIMSLFFSTALILGAQLDYYNVIIWNFLTIIKILLLNIFIQIILIHLINVLKNINNDLLKPINYKKNKLIIFFIIFVSWFIVYLALFPGIYGYDGMHQVAQMMGTVKIDSAHPIIHTILLGKSVVLGKFFFNNLEIGLGIYSLIQMIILCCISTKVCIYIFKKTSNKILRIGSVCFFSLLPLHHILVISTARDILFSGFFVLLFIEMIEMIENQYFFWNSFKKIIKFGSLIVLLLLFRHNGIYCILFSIPFFIFFIKIKKNKYKFIALNIIAILFSQFIQNIFLCYIFNASNKTNIREMLSIPVQQVARVFEYNPKKITKKQLQILKEVFPQKNPFITYKLTPLISDTIKSNLYIEQLQKNYFKYIKLYLDLGINNPKLYTEAFMLNSLNGWYPNKYFQDSRRAHPYIEVEMLEASEWSHNYFDINRKSFFPFIEKCIKFFMLRVNWIKIPIISSIFQSGTYSFLLFFALNIILFKKQYERLAPLSFLFGLWISVILGPVGFMRYWYPLIICAPILFLLIISDLNYKKTNK